jgi:hypothetical protein
MSKGIHKVVLYVHEKSRQFSITARTEHAQLPRVNQQMAQQGYTRIVLAEGLAKQQANSLRDRVRDACETMRYEYQPRNSLPW